MFEFRLSSLHTYYLFDVFNTSYCVEVENGALLCDVTWAWKMILGGHGNSWKSRGKCLAKKV